MTKTNRHLESRLVALMLGIGGVFGVGGVVWTGILGLRSGAKGPRVMAWFAVFLIVFIACIWAGVELWQKKPRAFRWAQGLLVAQMPVLNLPTFAYQFHTALSLVVLWNQASTVMNFEAELASQFTFRLSSATDDFVLGLNLAPALALYLLGRARAKVNSRVEPPAAVENSRSDNQPA